MAVSNCFLRKELARRARKDETDLSPQNECPRCEVEDLLRISSATLKGWASSGQVPCRKLGRKVLFFRSEILEFRKLILQRG